MESAREYYKTKLNEIYIPIIDQIVNYNKRLYLPNPDFDYETENAFSFIWPGVKLSFHLKSNLCVAPKTVMKMNIVCLFDESQNLQFDIYDYNKDRVIFEDDMNMVMKHIDKYVSYHSSPPKDILIPKEPKSKYTFKNNPFSKW